MRTCSNEGQSEEENRAAPREKLGTGAGVVLQQAARAGPQVT